MEARRLICHGVQKWKRSGRSFISLSCPDDIAMLCHVSLQVVSASSCPDDIALEMLFSSMSVLNHKFPEIFAFVSDLSFFSSSLQVLCNLAHICLIAQSPIFDIPYHASWPDKARIVWQDCTLQIRSTSPGRLPTYRSHSSQLCAFELGHLAVELSFLCVYVCKIETRIGTQAGGGSSTAQYQQSL